MAVKKYQFKATAEWKVVGIPDFYVKSMSEATWGEITVAYLQEIYRDR